MTTKLSTMTTVSSIMIAVLRVGTSAMIHIVHACWLFDYYQYSITSMITLTSISHPTGTIILRLLA